MRQIDVCRQCVPRTFLINHDDEQVEVFSRFGDRGVLVDAAGAGRFFGDPFPTKTSHACHSDASH